MVLASEALTSYMKAYLTHYKRQKEGLVMVEDDGEEDKRSEDGNNNEALVEDDDEGFLDYYYDIGTSAETMPNVNWTMLKPRSTTCQKKPALQSISQAPSGEALEAKCPSTASHHGTNH